MKRAREARRNDRSGRPLSQGDLYRLCVQHERAAYSKEQAQCFRRAGADPQRKFFIDVEMGRRALTPGQARILEAVFHWPDKALDEPFDSVDAFEKFCANTKASAETAAQSTREGKPPSPAASDRASRPAKKRRSNANLQLKGILTLHPNHQSTASRTALAKAIDAALQTTAQETLCVAAVHGERGAGKSELISEWWRRHGRARFTRCVFSLDCGRLAGDKILAELNHFFLPDPEAELTTALVAQINAQKHVLIVLDGLSQEESDPALTTGDEDSFSWRDGREVLAASGRADRTALRRVTEILEFLAHHGARASVLLGVQTKSGGSRRDAIDFKDSLDASVRLESIPVERLSPAEGAKLLLGLGASAISLSDLEHLSERLQGLPISLVAAGYYLAAADGGHAEAFLARIADRGRFKSFEEFFGPYLQALDEGDFDRTAHPLAFLRLLALMPGPIEKDQIDTLMSHSRIRRLEAGSTARFARMNIPFVVDLQTHIDLNPMVRELLRHELSRSVMKGGPVPTDRPELAVIHATMGSICCENLPEFAPSSIGGDFNTIEGALYHLLSVRDYLEPNLLTTVGEGPAKEKLLKLVGAPGTPEQITRYCLDEVARRFLEDRQHRATRMLGQFETKARLLSLFFENLDADGAPKHLSLWDQADLYGEMGVCWMHAGRLQLASDAMSAAIRCLSELGVEPRGPTTQHLYPPRHPEPWRLWSETVSNQALVAMRQGRQPDFANRVLGLAVETALALVQGLDFTLDAPPLGPDPALLAARRLICRSGSLAYAMGDLATAQSRYTLAAAIERRTTGLGLTGDALRRQIEVLVRRGACQKADLAQGHALIDAQLQSRRRGSSSDIIPMRLTKIMLLRASGQFEEAAAMLASTEQHEFVVRGECPFSARMELELERYRLMIASQRVDPDASASLALIIQELEKRHHALLANDARLVRAELEAEPLRSQLVNRVAQQIAGGWGLRREDVRVIREYHRSAVMSLGC